MIPIAAIIYAERILCVQRRALDGRVESGQEKSYTPPLPLNSIAPTEFKEWKQRQVEGYRELAKGYLLV